MTNNSNSSSKPHPHWKGERHKPRGVMTISPDYRRSRGVRAYYCKVVNGKVVNDPVEKPHDEHKRLLGFSIVNGKMVEGGHR